MGLLQYRIPGEAVYRKAGKWHEKALQELEAGDFVLSTFNKNRVYVFNESQDEGDFTFASEFPYAVAKEEYLAELSQFKNDFAAKGIAKAIFSRVHRVELAEQLNIDLAFERMCAEYPNAFVYLISGKEVGTWMGATPETLVSSKKEAFYTMSLAGTKKEKQTPWTHKEKEEQAFVTEYIIDRLNKVGVSNLQTDGPKDLFTGAVYHLKTDIYFQATIKEVNHLIELLHPTPAVCGVPTHKALALIDQYEKHSRDFYAGVIGRIGSERCDLFVNLRCMQVFKDALALYVGGGITKDSDVEDEYQETINKAQTLLKVLS